MKRHLHITAYRCGQDKCQNDMVKIEKNTIHGFSGEYNLFLRWSKDDYFVSKEIFVDHNGKVTDEIMLDVNKEGKIIGIEYLYPDPIKKKRRGL